MHGGCYKIYITCKHTICYNSSMLQIKKFSLFGKFHLAGILFSFLHTCGMPTKYWIILMCVARHVYYCRKICRWYWGHTHTHTHTESRPFSTPLGPDRVNESFFCTPLQQLLINVMVCYLRGFCHKMKKKFTPNDFTSSISEENSNAPFMYCST